MSISNLQTARNTTTDTSATNDWSASNDAARNTSTPGNSPAGNQHVDALREQLQREAQQDPAAFRSALRTAFGDKASLVQIDQLLDLALAGKLPMPASVRFVDAGSLGEGALGAYDSTHGGTLFLDRSLLDDDPVLLQSVFNEEMGHHFDVLLGGTDAVGDEGAVFAQTLDEGSLSQDTLSALKGENDHGLIQVDGRLIQVEFMEDGTGGEGSGESKEAGDGKDAGNTGTGNAANQDMAKSLTDTVADSAGAAKENLERSSDMQSNSTGLRGAFAYTADAFGRAFGVLSTALGFSKGYDGERDRGGSKADAVREGFRELALDFDDGVISGAGLTGGALLGGAIGTVTPAGPVGTAVGATGLGLAGAEAANHLWDGSPLDAGFDLGVNYVFNTIENWQHRE